MKVFWKASLLGFLVFVLTSVGMVSSASSGEEACTWTITKTASYNDVPVTHLTLAPGQQYMVNYSISVDVAPAGCTPYYTEVGVHDPFIADPISNPFGRLGTVTFGVDSLPKVFTYSRVIGPYADCGNYVVQNTAFIKSPPFEAHTTLTITVDVPCGGCTLTPGYWKTHSEYGPAPYDDTWALLDDGADTPFFLSGQSWYEVFWTEPRRGNAYYILAHAFMAASLNILNETTSLPDVDAAITWAEDFFGTYTPSSLLSKSFRNEVLRRATLLDDYNNGIIGPGHCSE